MGSMREDMPKCAQWMDELRAAFGKAEVDGWIRQGLREGTFYASENGHEVGKPVPPPANCIGVADMVLDVPEPEPEARPPMRYR